MKKTQEDNALGAHHHLLQAQKKKNTNKKNLGKKCTCTPTNVIGLCFSNGRSSKHNHSNKHGCSNKHDGFNKHGCSNKLCLSAHEL
jgi:hypothetical protein